MIGKNASFRYHDNSMISSLHRFRVILITLPDNISDNIAYLQSRSLEFCDWLFQIILLTGKTRQKYPPPFKI